MENFIFSLNATLPVFFVMFLGWVLLRTRLLNENFIQTADKYVFKIALPVLLFQDIATADITEVFDLTFILFCMCSTILMFLGVWLFSWLFIRDRSMVGAFAQGSARGSAAILGIAFVQNIYGDSGMAPLMIVSAVPFYNIISVIILTFHARGQENMDKRTQIRKACINVAKNPIIWGILSGLPFAVFHWTIPAAPAKAISYVASTATPLALLTIGAGFDWSKAMAKWKPALAASLIKLVVLPALFFPAALYFGFRQSELVAILVMLGSPTTVTCYIMAKNMGNDEVLSSGIIVLATLLSSVTLTGWIYLLRVFSLI
ncbi:MAG: AEC family transporter [Clostridiales bacterium]|nr:AEC family transporter [Clostridiales bacterium]